VSTRRAPSSTTRRVLGGLALCAVTAAASLVQVGTASAMTKINHAGNHKVAPKHTPTIHTWSAAHRNAAFDRSMALAAEGYSSPAVGDDVSNQEQLAAVHRAAQAATAAGKVLQVKALWVDDNIDLLLEREGTVVKFPEDYRFSYYAENGRRIAVPSTKYVHVLTRTVPADSR